MTPNEIKQTISTIYMFFFLHVCMSVFYMDVLMFEQDHLAERCALSRMNESLLYFIVAIKRRMSRLMSEPSHDTSCACAYIHSPSPPAESFSLLALL